MIRALQFAWSHWEIALVVTLLVILHYLWSERAQLSAAIALRAGESALQKKNYDKAFDLVSRLLTDKAVAAIDGNNKAAVERLAAALCIRGSVLVRRNEHEQALAEFDAAIDLAPNLDEAYIRRAAIYRKTGRIDEALADYDTIIARKPFHARAYVARAAALCVGARYEDALANCYTALGMQPRDAPLHRQVGLVQICARQFAQATATLSRAVSLDAKNRHGILLLHLARVGAGQDDARELRDNAGKIDGRSWPGPLVAHYLGDATPDQVLAAPRSDKATAQERLGEAAFYMGELALLGGHFVDAERLLGEAHQLCPASFIECWAAAAGLRWLASRAGEAARPPSVTASSVR